MNPKTDAQQTVTVSNNQPYAVFGADKLVSFLWKQGDEATGWQYRFNVFRCERQTGEANQLFGPKDVEALAKLTRLLAFELASDGCLPPDLRDDLACLAACLDEVLPASEPKPAAQAGHGGQS